MIVQATRPRPRPIAVLMRQRGVTVVALAATVGCTPVWLSQVINGRAEGSLQLRKALAMALGEPVDQLF
jgi:transcriptional regulator with XRE-family HTH domain